ncbi:MAG: DUF4249 domain-containing protein [Bacteroidales bacterium]|nr:DUF4249 domain-containing protein [Bacteroidales bacterium]
MRTKSLLYIFAVGIIFWVSCEEIVDNVDLPEAKPKLVVYSYIQPGTDTITAQVSLSRPITEPWSYEQPFLDDAEVSIKVDQGQEIALQFDPNTNHYFSAVGASFIEVGKKYEINVKSRDGKEVAADCVIPAQNTSLRIVKIDSVEIENRTRYRFRFEFDDPIGAPNYYRLIPKAIMKSEWEGVEYIYEYDANFSYGEQYIAVKERDGETFILECDIEVWTDPGWSGGERLAGVKTYLLSTDEHYYHYHHSLENYEPDNPFSEPTIIYTNMNNGLGVFAGYNPFVLEYWMDGPR